MNIYASQSCRRMRAHAADRVFRIAVVLASPSVVPAARGPSLLAAKLAAGHGAGVSGNPGRDVGRVHEDPGRFVAEERTPVMDLQRGSGLGTSRWSSPVRSQSPGVGGCDWPTRPHPYPVVTLSDMGGQGERSPSRRSARMATPRRSPVEVLRSGCSARMSCREGSPNDVAPPAQCLTALDRGSCVLLAGTTVAPAAPGRPVAGRLGHEHHPRRRQVGTIAYSSMRNHDPSSSDISLRQRMTRGSEASQVKRSRAAAPSRDSNTRRSPSIRPRYTSAWP